MYNETHFVFLDKSANPNEYKFYRTVKGGKTLTPGLYPFIPEAYIGPAVVTDRLPVSKILLKICPILNTTQAKDVPKKTFFLTYIMDPRHSTNAASIELFDRGKLFITYF